MSLFYGWQLVFPDTPDGTFDGLQAVDAGIGEDGFQPDEGLFGSQFVELIHRIDAGTVELRSQFRSDVWQGLQWGSRVFVGCHGRGGNDDSSESGSGVLDFINSARGRS